MRSRVARILLRHPRGAGRDVRQEVDDLVQDAVTALFADGARALRRWQPERGLSLRSFVGLLAEQTVLQVLRSRRRSPWSEDAMDPDELAPLASSEPGPDRTAVARHDLDVLLDRLRARLSPKALLVFELAVVAERPVEDVCALAGMTPDAVYAWRSRLRGICAEVAAEMSGPVAVEHSPGGRV